jgi:uncharacterized protein (TIGR03435 family)
MLRSRALWFICASAVLSCIGAGLLAQQAPASPTFEAASIKPHKSVDASGGFRVLGGRWQMVNLPMAALIRTAYPTKADLVGAPEWVTSERYDVEAKAEGQPTNEQYHLMLRGLLAERFNFRSHYEAREQLVYALVTARNDGRL